MGKREKPFNIFKDSDKLKDFIEIISSYSHQSPQRYLFEIEEGPLDILTKLASTSDKLYKRWTKLTGSKERHLAVPNPQLKKFINLYVLPLIKKTKCHQAAHGGEPSWNPKKSLETILPCKTAFSFDLKSAFDNIKIDSIFNFFYNSFLGISKEYKRDFANFLTTISTVSYNGKRVLPQGAPHSMALFNRIFYKLDTILFEKSKQKNLDYIRWVDDITFGSQGETDLKQFLGVIPLVEGHVPVAQNKIFFQKNPKPIYLLGQVLEKNKVFKNSKYERKENKVPPLDYNRFFNEKSCTHSPW